MAARKRKTPAWPKASSAGKCRDGGQHVFDLHKPAEGKTGKLFRCRKCEHIYEVEEMPKRFDSTTGRILG